MQFHHSYLANGYLARFRNLGDEKMNYLRGFGYHEYLEDQTAYPSYVLTLKLKFRLMIILLK